MDRFAHHPAGRRPNPTAAPPEGERSLPAWSELGLGPDEPDFDPAWCPAVLTGAAWRPRPRWWWAWRALRRNLSTATSTVVVLSIGLVILAGLPIPGQPGPEVVDPPPTGSQTRLGSAVGVTAAMSSQSALADAGSVAATVPAPQPGVKVVYAGPPPPRMPVRLDEPVLYWLPEILAASERTGVPASLIAGIIKVESQGDPGVVSPAGARGLMQLMPPHLEEQGIDPSLWHDPATNIHAGALLLKWKIETAGTEWDGVRYYFGPDKCDAFTCTEEYVSRVYSWRDHYAPLIADPYGAGIRMLPAR